MDQTLVSDRSLPHSGLADNHPAYTQSFSIVAADDPLWERFRTQLNGNHAPERCACRICREHRGEPPLPSSAYNNRGEGENTDTESNATDAYGDIPELELIETTTGIQGTLSRNSGSRFQLPLPARQAVSFPSNVGGGTETLGYPSGINRKLWIRYHFAGYRY